MSAQFSKGDKVRCIKTWTTYVIDSGSEYEVDGVHIDAIDGEMLYVESQWVPAHYFEKVGPQRDFDCCIAASHIHGTINTPIGSVSGTLSAEPEDKADLYVEPEPLKEGDAVLVWAKVVDPEQDELGDFAIDVMYGATFDRTFARADAIVRPGAGQVPPWVKPARCTSLYEHVGSLHRCDLDAGHEDHPGHSNVNVGWTTADEAGRIIESGVS